MKEYCEGDFYVSSFLPNSEEFLQSNNDRHALLDELSQTTSSEAP